MDHNGSLGAALPNFLQFFKIIQLPPILRIFEILERTKKRKGGSTKKGGSWGVRFLDLVYRLVDLVSKTTSIFSFFQWKIGKTY